jgi:hypothetical protein
MAENHGVSESDLYKPILDYLHLCGIPATRKQSGVLHLGNRWVNMGEAGWPDIIGVLPPDGRFLGIEVKLPGEDLRRCQMARTAELREAGALMLVVRSIEDLAALIEVRGCLPRA